MSPAQSASKDPTNFGVHDVFAVPQQLHWHDPSADTIVNHSSKHTTIHVRTIIFRLTNRGPPIRAVRPQPARQAQAGLALLRVSFSSGRAEGTLASTSKNTFLDIPGNLRNVSKKAYTSKCNTRTCTENSKSFSPTTDNSSARPS
jgi:hypothetical protein